MLDLVSVFTTTGVVLWSRTYCAIRGDPINALIRGVILEERATEEFTYDHYKVLWLADNKRGLVYVAVRQSIVPPAESQRLLKLLKKDFGAQYPKVPDARAFSQEVDYDATFDALLEKAQRRTTRVKEAVQEMVHKHAPSSSDSKKKKKNKKKKKKKKAAAQVDSDDDMFLSDPGSDSDVDIEDAGNNSDGAMQPPLIPLPTREASDVESSDEGVAPPSVPLPARVPPATDGDQDTSESGDEATGTGSPEAPAVPSPKLTPAEKARRLMAARSKRTASPKKSPTKARRKPDRTRRRIPLEPKKTVTAADMAALDRSNPSESNEAARKAAAERYMGSKLEEDSSSDEDEEKKSSASWFSTSSIGGLFQTLTGKKELLESDLAPVMEQMRAKLVDKNVASAVAMEICGSVQKSLIGRKLERLTRIATIVRSAMETALERVLTPKKSTDVLAAIAAKKRAGAGPFVIVFIGVNGVGKSTSLAKICSYIRQREHSVLIAACDTFRAGAVEQLRTHCDRLNVKLYERGYAKDPALIAKAAVKSAAEGGQDVVLIDTAGRMQNNEPLMRALAKLVAINNPDLVLFVGEALVGNDGIDQLSTFNKALIDYGEVDPPRTIDGIVLTKYDTIDDKVGAAVSMSHKTGKPIMFVGTGQHYANLKRLNVADVVNSLCA